MIRPLYHHAPLSAIGIAVSLICLLPGRALSAARPDSPASNVSKRASISYGKLPLSFEPNLGQTAKEVQWLARGPQYTLYLIGPNAVLQLNDISPARRPGERPAINSSALRMNLLGAKAAERGSGEEPQQGKANYFTSNDPSKWQKNVPMYGKVRMEGVYRGIDLVYYGHRGQLEYDFVVAPGADPSAIRLSFDGAKAKLAADGDLVLPVTGGGPEVRFHKPVVYQMKDGVRQPVDGSFVIAENRQVSFKLGVYDKSHDLIIDPTLIFLGVLGTGNQQTVANGMAVDSLGEIILTGITNDLTFPVTAGALQPSCTNSSTPFAASGSHRCGASSASSGFVTKISADGTSLVYSTYLHGLSGQEWGQAVAADATGDAYVLGATESNDFPVTANAYLSTCLPYYPGSVPPIAPSCDGYFAGGGTEYVYGGPAMFIAELNPSGSALIYSTFFSGTSAVYPAALALDSSNNMYFTGFVQDAYSAPNIYPANSSQGIQFPVTTSAYQSVGVDVQAATLSELSADGQTLVYSTLLGALSTPNDGFTVPEALALGPNGMAYLGGYTTSFNFPTTSGVVSPTCLLNPGDASASSCYGATGFLSAFDTAKSGSASLVYSTFIGAAVPVPAGQGTSVYGVAADSSNNAYVTGYTSENNYPVTPSAILPTCRENPNDPVGQGTCAVGFLSKINPTGTAFVWSTFFGGTAGSTSQGNSIAFDAKGQVYLYGYNSNYGYDLPLVNPIEPRPSGSYAFVATFSADGTKLLFSTPIGNQSAPAVNIYPIANNGMALDATGNIYFGAYGADSGAMVITPGTYATADTGGFQRSFFGKISPVAPATTTTLAIAPSTAGTGQNVTFTATVAGTTQATPTPTGTVTLANQNTTPPTTLGTITLGSTGSGTLSTTSLAAGSYSVTASYSGDSNYDVSTSAPQALTITSLPATTTALAISPTGPLTYGQQETLTATVTQTGGGTPTGTVTFTEGSTTLGTSALNGSGVATLSTMLPVGMGNLVAAYGGSATSAASSSTSTMVTVAQANLTVTAANVSRVVGVANPTLTGTITGAVNGDTFTATYSTNATIASPPGSYPITPSVTGTNIADYNVNLVNGTLTVTPPTATTTKLTSSAATAVVGTTLTFTATVTGPSGTPAPTGTVTFKDGTTTIGMGTLSGAGVATYTTATLAAATHSITASYAGDTSNASSVSAAVSVTVTAPTATTTALTSSSSSVVVGTSITLTATVTGATGTPAPTGMVTFNDGANPLGTVAINGSGVATYTTSTLAAGSHSITASYAGDTSNAASISGAVSVAVWPGAAAYTVSLSPSSGTFPAGSPVVITITVTSVNGFNSATSLACGSLPQNTTCTFSSTSITPTVSGTATSMLTIATNVKASSVTLRSEASRSTPARLPFQRPIGVAGALAAFLLVPMFAARNRKLRRLLLTTSSAILIAVIALIGMSGCGGSSGPKTPTGTYSIQVTATSGSLTQSATYSLTVQ